MHSDSDGSGYGGWGSRMLPPADYLQGRVRWFHGPGWYGFPGALKQVSHPPLGEFPADLSFSFFRRRHFTVRQTLTGSSAAVLSAVRP